MSVTTVRFSRHTVYHWYVGQPLCRLRHTAMGLAWGSSGDGSCGLVAQQEAPVAKPGTANGHGGSRRLADEVCRKQA